MPDFLSFAAVSAGDDDDATAVRPFMAPELLSLGSGAVDARRSAFLLGRRAAHQALHQLGRDVGPILIGDQRQPLWPNGVVGSISHTDEWAVALIALQEHALGVGIDVEARGRTADELAGIYEQATVADERRWLDALPVGQREEQLLGIFSAKESTFKALFPIVNELFGFSAIALEPTNNGYCGTLRVDLHPRLITGYSLDIHCRRHEQHVLTWLVLPPV